MSAYSPIRVWVFIVVVCLCSVVWAERSGWQRRGVDWRISGGVRIKAVNYPIEKVPVFRAERKVRTPTVKTTKPKAVPSVGPSVQAVAAVIDSPPIDGFVPWVVALVTDERGEELELEAIPMTTIVGNFPPGCNPQTDYAVGILDTGASVSLMANAAAVQAGMFNGHPNLVSNNTISITGVTGSADIWVSQPIGLYIDGISAVNPAGLLVDTSGMVGEVNVAIGVGQASSIGLPTAIGTPLSVFYTAHFRNDHQITITHNAEEFTGPAITFHDLYDPAIPSYSKVVPLELRPLGGYYVQYVPYLNLFDIFEDPFNLDFSTPQTPSTIMGNLSQSVLFVHSVDVTDSRHVAYDKDRFLFDTGAQVTVIGSRIAARLALDPANPEFEVEIQGITGDVVMAPGFYVDLLQIPALGEWLEFTNVPVVLLDIASPEGGTVDGIIGMNLFVDYNFVLRGGGLFLQDDPSLELEPIAEGIIADIAPKGGDGVVNIRDLTVFMNAWLATTNPPSGNWNPGCDIAPQPVPDGRVNLLDFALLAEYWLHGTSS